MALLNSTPQEYYNGNDHGDYQFVSLTDIINQFMLIYVGEDKIIPKAKRLDVAFHAQRALAELSFDTFKSCKSQEITVPASLQMILPQDYVNYTKISWVDSAGIKHLLYPASKTSNPSSVPFQDSDGNFKLELEGTIVDASNSITLTADRAENVLVGMVVTGLHIPTATTVFVKSVSHGTSSTTITLHDGAGVDINATGTAKALLQFTNLDGSLLKPENAVHVVDDLDWNITDYKITANAAADISSLEVGMLVYHEQFPVGTKIISLPPNHSSPVTTIIVDQLPTDPVLSNAGQVVFVDPNKDSTTWSSYKSATPSENQNTYQDDTYWPIDGERYGLDPQHAQANGSFYIDCVYGKIYFSSNISGKTVILDYISDSLGTDGEMQVHKFAEEAMYKWISHAILSGKANVPEYQVNRLKKERFAATRTAKLRLSNLKIEELTQILRGKSKWIKH